MYCWIGFRKKEIKFEQEDRVAGTSSFNFFSLLSLAVEGVTSFTVAPLRISTFAGIIVSLVAFIYMCFIMFKTLICSTGFPYSDGRDSFSRWDTVAVLGSHRGVYRTYFQ